MTIDTLFRRMPPSPRLHGYARTKLAGCAEHWNRRLDLRLSFTRDAKGVSLELCGRDSEGHFISCRSQGADGYSAVDNLCRTLSPQGLLLAHASPRTPAYRGRRPGRQTPLY